MKTYEQDIFYQTDSLSLDQKRELLKEMMERNESWHIDVLEANISFARRKTDMTFDEMLKKLDKRCHFCFVHRKGFKNSEGNPFSGEYLLEGGFSTMRDPEYFLWIFCNQNDVQYFVDKYNLKIL